MPSLRQKVTTYFRQLSFIAEPRDGPRSPRKTEDDGNFITKYLEGRMDRIFVPGPDIYNGQNPIDLPELHIATYPTGPNTITAACTGPDDGLTGIKRSKLHLSASYADDIDFIDTIQESDCLEVRKSISNNTRTHSKFSRFANARKLNSNSSNNTGTATTPTSDQNANKTFSTSTAAAASGAQSTTAGGMRSRKNSKTGIANLQKQQQQHHTATDPAATKLSATKKEDNSNKATTIVVSMVSSTKSATSARSSSPLTTIKLTTTTSQTATDAANDQNNKNLINAKTDATTATTTTTTTIKELTKENAPPTATTTLVTNGTKDISNNTTTTKILEDATARLLREAVSNQAAEVGCNGGGSALLADPIAGVTNWKMETECAYGISVSLYENNMLTKEPMGNPIADCYGMVVRGDSAVLALADGVNWGDGARLAARSAVHGCLDYLDRAIFGLATECMATTTQEVFVSLLRALWEGHGCILEVGGALSTLTIAVILPLTTKSEEHEELEDKYVVCACNVGDSLGYVYSKKHGVREFTQASHDISSMRDMRDALGALGPADGNKPELSNLTLSMTTIERGDIVFLTSDGISDNFDPVVGKFAEAWTPDVKINSTTHSSVLAPKRQNKSASSIYARLHHHNRNEQQPTTPPVRPPRTKKSSSPDDVSSCVSSSSSSSAASAAPSRPKYMRSQTVIEPRRISSAGSGGGGNPAVGRQATIHHHQQQQQSRYHTVAKIPKSIAGLPLVTGPQRHALTLHRLEDLLSYGINGTFSPCVSARRLCHLLIDFVRMITSARRKTLEQREIFYKLSTGPDGIKREVELNRMQHRAARKRIVDSSGFAALPGKLDHATVVAYTVGGGNTHSCHVDVTNETMTPTINNALTGGKAPLQSQEFQETNF